MATIVFADMDNVTLTAAIKNSGGGPNALDEADALLARIAYLESTGRYRSLVSQLGKANDKSNLLALVLEVNFAYQFESRGRTLTYEVRQNPQHKSSIDFLRTLSSGPVFFELRLLQTAQPIAESMNAQLKAFGMYRIALDGEDQQGEVLRIQNVVLSKVQDKSGNPINFFSTACDASNIVVIDATDSILGTVDIHDCLLATHGDPAVHEAFRGGIFGLFQQPKPEYPRWIQDLAAKYQHIRETLHGVLFLFKKRGAGILVYDLEQYLIWNPTLVQPDQAKPVIEDLVAAIPQRCKRR
jgi:hypothetical protein